MGRAGGAEGPQERLQSLAAMERMLREEESLGERSSDEFERNKGKGRAEEGKGALE